MQQKQSTQPVTTKPTPFQRLVAAIAARIERENEPQHPGVIVDYSGRGIDDGGGYGDPMIDTRPSFIIEDEKGWERLK